MVLNYIKIKNSVPVKFNIDIHHAFNTRANMSKLLKTVLRVKHKL